MSLNREQFDYLVAVTKLSETNPQDELGRENIFSQDVYKHTDNELRSAGFISNGLITKAGLLELEPYRVKRAVFLAAGIGSRLKPITINTPKPLVTVHGVRIIDRLIDACLRIGIEEIYIVRGYRAELFDQLVYKYPMVKFVDNAEYNQANNISSAIAARDFLANTYVFEADLLISNVEILKKYHYQSGFLAIKKEITDDWCFKVNNRKIVEEKHGGEGPNIWQMVGISYWDKEDGERLSQDLEKVYRLPEGKKAFWEQVPLVYCKEKYSVEIQECLEEDIVEIDTFEELKAIDEAYSIE